MQKLLLVTVLSGVFIAACGGAKVENGSKAEGAPANEEAVSAPPIGGSAQTPTAAIEELVRDLYKQHDAKKSPFFQTTDRARVDKYFTKELADLIWKDAKTADGAIGAIDFDPLYDAQDIDIKNLVVGSAVNSKDAGTVPVTFANFGSKKTITFSIKLNGENWRISDIKYSAGQTLLKIIKANSAETKSTAPDGEFEGKYQVGETTCVVSPARQSFTVKWAKGSGVEYFFYKDGNTFESEPDKDGLRNEFQFTDENYNTGTFYRGDGKTFPVKRAK